jgi:hypothetical protein
MGFCVLKRDKMGLWSSFPSLQSSVVGGGFIKVEKVGSHPASRSHARVLDWDWNSASLTSLSLKERKTRSALKIGLVVQRKRLKSA